MHLTPLGLATKGIEKEEDIFFSIYPCHSADPSSYFFFVSGKNVFGSTYSGLQYDYRGLLNLYAKLGEYDKVGEYSLKLEQWSRLREQNVRDDFPTATRENPLPLAQVIKSFFQDD